MKVEQAVERIARCATRHIIVSSIAAEADEDPGDVDAATAWAVKLGFCPHLARVEHAIDFVGDVDRGVQRQGGNVRHSAIERAGRIPVYPQYPQFNRPIFADVIEDRRRRGQRDVLGQYGNAS